MPKIKHFLPFLLLLMTSVVHAASAMILTTTTTSIVLNANGSETVSYALKNNSTQGLYDFTFYPDYGGGNVASMSIQNNTCTGTLNPNASCTFQVNITGVNQPQSFTLSPRVCAKNGTICAQTTATYRPSVVVLSSPVPVNTAYFGITSIHSDSTASVNTLQLVNMTTGTLGNVISGFNFAPTAYFTAQKELLPNNNPVSEFISANGTTLYVTNNNITTVSVVDLTLAPPAIVKNIDLGYEPIAVTGLPNNTTIYASDSNGEIVVINNNVITSRFSLPVEGALGAYLAVNPAGTSLYVADNVEQAVYIYNTAGNTLSGTLDLSGDAQPPTAIAVNNDYLYVSNGNHLSVYDVTTLSLVKNINPGGTKEKEDMTEGGFEGLTFSPNQNILYAAKGDIIYLIDTSNNIVTNAIHLPTSIVSFGLSLNADGSLLAISSISAPSQLEDRTITPAVLMYIMNTTTYGFTAVDIGGQSHSWGIFAH